jgi:hypothetical protein
MVLNGVSACPVDVTVTGIAVAISSTTSPATPLGAASSVSRSAKPTPMSPAAPCCCALARSPSRSCRRYRTTASTRLTRVVGCEVIPIVSRTGGSSSTLLVRIGVCAASPTDRKRQEIAATKRGQVRTRRTLRRAPPIGLSSFASDSVRGVTGAAKHCRALARPRRVRHAASRRRPSCASRTAPAPRTCPGTAGAAPTVRRTPT